MPSMGRKSQVVLEYVVLQRVLRKREREIKKIFCIICIHEYVMMSNTAE
jgi:hypothetical protein